MNLKLYGDPKRILIHGVRSERFYCRVYDTETGKRTWKSTGKTSKDAALRQKRAWECEDALPKPESDEAEPVLASVAIDDWLKVKKDEMTPAGYVAYDQRCKLFKDDLPAGILLRDVELKHLEKHIQRRSVVVAAATLNKTRAMLRQLFSWAMDQTWIVASPARGLKRRTEPKREIRALTIEEERKLLAKIQEKRTILCVGKRNTGSVKGGTVTEDARSWPQEVPRPKWLFVLTFVALRTGLRLGTLRKLTWGDVDFQAHVLRLAPEKMKSREALTVPLDADTEILLRARRKLSRAMLVFPDLPDDRAVLRAFQTAVEDAELRWTRFHDLRATFVSRLCVAGVGVDLAAKLAGHADISTTMRHYRQVGEAELVAAVRKVEEARAANASEGAGGAGRPPVS